MLITGSAGLFYCSTAAAKISTASPVCGVLRTTFASVSYPAPSYSVIVTV